MEENTLLQLKGTANAGCGQPQAVSPPKTSARGGGQLSPGEEGSVHRVNIQNFTNKIAGKERAALCCLVYGLAVRVEWALRRHPQAVLAPGISCLTAVQGRGERGGIYVTAVPSSSLGPVAYIQPLSQVPRPASDNQDVSVITGTAVVV